MLLGSSALGPTIAKHANAPIIIGIIAVHLPATTAVLPINAVRFRIRIAVLLFDFQLAKNGNESHNSCSCAYVTGFVLDKRHLSRRVALTPTTATRYKSPTMLQ